jgi:hypothetical protein
MYILYEINLFRVFFNLSEMREIFGLVIRGGDVRYARTNTTYSTRSANTQHVGCVYICARVCITHEACSEAKQNVRQFVCQCRRHLRAQSR